MVGSQCPSSSGYSPLALDPHHCEAEDPGGIEPRAQEAGFEFREACARVGGEAGFVARCGGEVGGGAKGEEQHAAEYNRAEELGHAAGEYDAAIDFLCIACDRHDPIATSPVPVGLQFVYYFALKLKN